MNVLSTHLDGRLWLPSPKVGGGGLNKYQGPPADESVPPVGQPAGVGLGGENVHQDSHSWERPGHHHPQQFGYLFEAIQLDFILQLTKNSPVLFQFDGWALRLGKNFVIFRKFDGVS